LKHTLGMWTLSGAVLSYGGSIVGSFSLLIGLLRLIGIFMVGPQKLRTTRSSHSVRPG
jgi:hypothetical protein